MAYKFQLGAAVLSGSLTQEGDITGEGDLVIQNSGEIGCAADSNLITLANQSVAFANDADVNIAKAGGLQIAGSAVTATAAELNLLDGITRGSILIGGSGGSAELDAKTSGRILVGDGTDIASVAVSGDATLAASGALTIAAGAIEHGMLAEDIISGQSELAHADIQDADDLMIHDATAGAVLKVGVDSLRDHFFGAISGDAAVADGGALTIQANAVEGSMLNSNVAGDGLSYAGNNIDVDAAQTVITSIYNTSLKIGRGATDDNIDFGTDDSIIFNVDNGEKFRVASGSAVMAVDTTFEGGVTIEGNLSVTGTTVTVDSTNILVTGSISFEGSTANDFETTLGVVDPTADRAINLANVGGTLIPFAAASTTAISASPAELNLLDAGQGSSTGLQDGDSFIMFDNSASDAASKVLMSDIKTYIGNTSNLDVALKDDTNTLAVGVNYFADLGGAEAANLPASPDVGDAVYIKAPSNCSTSNTLTINRQGSHTIDGVNSIVLESPHAAVMCVYVVANVWKVF